MQGKESMYLSFQRVCQYKSSDVSMISPGEKLANDHKALVERMRKDGYTEEEIMMVTGISSDELEMAAKNIMLIATMKTQETPAITKSDKPTLYHVAGQPGCGKSAAIKAIQKSSPGVPFISEMDVYRTKHPRIKEIKKMIAKKYPDDLERQGKEFIAFTSFFADLLELTVISYAISQGYSVIKETTGKNARGICGMISALKSQYPNMSASMACMAVATDVSIDGTISRGNTMESLTTAFVEDLKDAGINATPVGRGKVPRSFSEKTCQQIPDAMARVAESGLIDGEFLIVKRGSETEDKVVSRISGAECPQRADEIRTILADRILGSKAKEEENLHFAKKKAEREKAEREEAERKANDKEEGMTSPIIQLYLYPTRTWLKETDGALDFYKKKSGLVDTEQIAAWVIKQKLLPALQSPKASSDSKETSSDSKEASSDSKETSSDSKEILSEIDLLRSETNEAMIRSGGRLCDIVVDMTSHKNKGK